MLWMSVRDKCIEISLITRSYRLSPSWLTALWVLERSEPSIELWTWGFLCVLWKLIQPDRREGPLPVSQAWVLFAGKQERRSQGAWVTLPAGAMAETLDHTNPLLFVIEIIEADMLLSMICHHWSLTMLSIRYKRHHLQCQRTLQAHMACFSCWLPSLRTACDGAFDWQARHCHFSELKHTHTNLHVFTYP